MTEPVLQQIVARFETADNLPSLPKVAIEVLRLTQLEDVSVATIAEAIQQDPALTAKLLKVVNSSLFGMSREISSLQQATVVLGLRTVKVMVLSFSLVDSMQGSGKKEFDYEDYWRRSLTTAVSARLIAEASHRELSDQAFVTGLLSDIGVLAAHRCAHDLYGKALAAFDPHLGPLQAVEQRMLGFTHEQLSEALLRHWKLPEPLCAGVATHHADINGPCPANPLMEVLLPMVRSASRISDLFCSPAMADQLETIRQRVMEGLGFSAEKMDGVLHDLDGHVSEMASVFALNIGTPRSYQDIQAQAAAQLARLTMAVELERAQLAEREQEAREHLEELNEQNQRLTEQATTDSLTGVANRPALERRFEDDFQTAALTGGTAGVIILDLDRFKKLNDTFGHRAGDEALRAVGGCLRLFEGPEVFVARYGGEEFAVLTTNHDERQLRELAESIRLAVQGLEIRHEDRTIRVTASFGAALARSADPMAPPNLIEMADQCLYEAKRSGRNRTVFQRAGSTKQGAAAAAR